MELKDFVKETIVQIAKGIEEASTELSDSDVMVNPIYVTMHSENAQSYGRTTTHTDADEEAHSRVIQKLEFDIAVSVESGQQGSVGAKLSIASIGIGADGKTESSKKSESRIKFSVPVVLPGYKNEC